MANLNLSSETSWEFVGQATLENPNHENLTITIPVLGTTNCYRVYASSTDPLAISRGWRSAGRVNLIANSQATESQNGVLERYALPLNKARIIISPYRTSEYRLEWEPPYWLQSGSIVVDQTVAYLDLDPNANLILNELDTIKQILLNP